MFTDENTNDEQSVSDTTGEIAHGVKDAAGHIADGDVAHGLKDGAEHVSDALSKDAEQTKEDVMGDNDDEEDDDDDDEEEAVTPAA